ncbi:MAG: hypothetical protein ABIM97_08370 [Ginsengibacter sp.]
MTSLFLTSLLYAQQIKRLEGETTDQFAGRLKPDSSELTHKVIDTKWNSTSVIIAFYQETYKLPKQNDPDQQDYLRIVGTIFIQSDSNSYEKFPIDIFDSEGGNPVIESVFFANADNDNKKELIIIVSWNQVHYDVGGILYNTFIYDNLINAGQTNLSPMKDLSEKLDGGCDCSWRDGTSRKAKYKTASDIKKGLTKLGFKQHL